MVKCADGEKTNSATAVEGKSENPPLIVYQHSRTDQKEGRDEKEDRAAGRRQRVVKIVRDVSATILGQRGEVFFYFAIEHESVVFKEKAP